MTEPRAPRSASSDEPIVQLHSLGKRFAVQRSWGEIIQKPWSREFVAAVEDVSLDVRRGEFFGLLGVNGAGKTTVFKILATLTLPDSGRATVDGWDVAKHPEQVRRVLTPVVADERSLYWRLSADENLRLYAALHRVPREQRRRRIAEVLDVVGLADVGQKQVGAYSSGMKQRLVIARSLLGRPKVLLLDEPTRSLDPISARRFRQFLREEIAGRQGCSVLLATHSAEEALELCDRVAVLDRGRRLASGTVDELAARFGEQRYQVGSTARAEAALRMLEREGVIADLRASPTDGRAQVEYRMRMCAPEGAARVLDVLVREKHAVAYFAPITLTLADLLERIVPAQGSSHG